MRAYPVGDRWQAKQEVSVELQILIPMQTIERIIQLTDLLLAKHRGNHLSPIQKVILRESLSGSHKTYAQIAQESGYAETYIKRKRSGGYAVKGVDSSNGPETDWFVGIKEGVGFPCRFALIVSTINSKTFRF